VEREARGQLVRAIAIAAVLFAVAYVLPGVRHRLIAAVTSWDASPSEPARLPPADGPALSAAPRVRVILIDGLAAETARTLPAWSATCQRGVALTMDVGFPTVSLAVEAALWSGLTQQQSGIVFRSDHPLEPPLAGIPAQVPNSIAIAEDHGYIVRSLGFATALPAADPADHARDADAATWKTTWQARATEAVASDARLVFVHLLRVDSAGHHFGRDSSEYRAIAGEADAILGGLVATAPDARWFLLSDHGHLAAGGHGGEERDVRQVEACVAGPGLEALVAAAGRSTATGPHKGPGPRVHVVDVARAIADSVGAKLDRGSLARPLAGAVIAPLADDQAVPPRSRAALVLAIVIVVLGFALGSWVTPRWWLQPWWFALALLSFVIVRGPPTLSMPAIWGPTGRAMYVTWLPALAVAAAATYVALGRTTLVRAVTGQLALPYATLAAALAVCGAWPVLVGAEVAPVVPTFTAWLSPLVLIAAHGSAAVALAVLGRSVRSAFGRPSPPETPRSAPAAS
jgi:hypothetical protein